jgi:hypothetical protein
VGKRAYQGSPPPTQVVMLGCHTLWTEADYRPGRKSPLHPEGCRCGCERAVKPQHGRDDCPCGCKGRDLDRERARGLDRVCLRCYCHTEDPPGWRPIFTISAMKAARKAEVDRTAREKQISFAARRFGAAERKRTGQKAG